MAGQMAVNWVGSMVVEMAECWAERRDGSRGELRAGLTALTRADPKAGQMAANLVDETAD